MPRIVISPNELGQLSSVYRRIGRDFESTGQRVSREASSVQRNAADPGFNPGAFRQRVNDLCHGLGSVANEYVADAELVERTASEGEAADLSSLAPGMLEPIRPEDWRTTDSQFKSIIQFGSAVDNNRWWQLIDRASYYRQIVTKSPTIARVLGLDRLGRAIGRRAIPSSPAGTAWRTLSQVADRSAKATTEFGFRTSFNSIKGSTNLRFGALGRFGPHSRFSRHLPRTAAAARRLADSVGNLNVARGRATLSLSTTLARRQRQLATSLRLSGPRTSSFTRSALRVTGSIPSRLQSTAGRFLTRFPRTAGALARAGRFARFADTALGIAGVAFSAASAIDSLAFEKDYEAGAVSTAKAVGGLMMFAGGPTTMTAGLFVVGGAMIWEAHGDTIKRAAGDAADWTGHKLNEAANTVVSEVGETLDTAVDLVTDPVGSVKSLFGFGG